jgi:hypothetical protein
MPKVPEWFVVWRESLDFDTVEYGGLGITVLRPDNISRHQAGFAVSADGRPRAGTLPGDWRAEWLVIGLDTACGDPIFTSDDSGHSVFTAMHGEGSWAPKLVAPSLEVFALCLRAFRQLASGRSRPDELETNPPPVEEQARFLDEIGRLAGGDEEARKFWAVQIDIDLDTFQG